MCGVTTQAARLAQRNQQGAPLSVKARRLVRLNTQELLYSRSEESVLVLERDPLHINNTKGTLNLKSLYNVLFFSMSL